VLALSCQPLIPQPALNLFFEFPVLEDIFGYFRYKCPQFLRLAVLQSVNLFQKE
jgi:hypothetical protein